MDFGNSSLLGAFLAAMGGLLLTIGFFTAAKHPQWFVKGLGRARRAEYRGMSDIEIDKMPLPPWDRFLVGSMSEFVCYAAIEPDRFPRVVKFFRFFFLVGAGFSLLMFSSQVIFLILRATR